jgi:hypothetical protein
MEAFNMESAMTAAQYSHAAAGVRAPHRGPNKGFAITVFIIAVLFHLAMLGSLRYHYLNPLFVTATHSEGQAGDFFGIYQAGVYAQEDKDIYTDPLLDEETIVPYGYFYRYLPFVAFTFSAALSQLPPWEAYWLWVFFTELVLIVCILLTKRLTHSISAFLVAAALWLGFSPYYIELYMGQFTFLTAALAFFAVYLLMRSRPFLCGLSWISSILIKHYTILLIPMLLRFRRFKTVLLGVIALAGASIPYFYFKDVGWSSFLHTNFQPHLDVFHGNYGVLAFVMVLKNWLIPNPSYVVFQVAGFDFTITRILILGVMAISTLLAVQATFGRKSVEPVEAFAVWTILYFFVYKEVWEYHFVALMPVMVLLYIVTYNRFILLSYLWLAIPTPSVFYDVPTAQNTDLIWPVYIQIVHHGFKVAPLVLLFLWVVGGNVGRAKAIAHKPKAKPREFEFTVDSAGNIRG